MRYLSILALGLLIALSAGCKKPAPPQQTSTPPPPGPTTNDKTTAHAPTGVVINPGLGGGGSGGAAQMVRKAAKAAATRNEMNQLKLFVANLELTDGRIPTGQQTAQALAADPSMRVVSKLVQEQSLVLVPMPRQGGVLAYSSEPQTAGGMYLVLMHGVGEAVQNMSGADLQQRLR